MAAFKAKPPNTGGAAGAIRLQEGAQQRQIGRAGHDQRDRQRGVNSLAGGLADDAHDGRSIRRFYPESPVRYFWLDSGLVYDSPPPWPSRRQ